MKLRIMVLILVALVGAQVMARDLAQIRNYRELEGLVYSKLSPAEQEQLLNLALRSQLPSQSIAARNAISRHFKGINWNELTKIEANQGLKGVKNRLGITPAVAPIKAGVTVTTITKAPIVNPAEPAQSVIKTEQLKTDWKSVADEFIADAQTLLQGTDIQALRAHYDRGGDLQNEIGGSDLNEEEKINLMMYDIINPWLDKIEAKLGINKKAPVVQQTPDTSKMAAQDKELKEIEQRVANFMASAKKFKADEIDDSSFNGLMAQYEIARLSLLVSTTIDKTKKEAIQTQIDGAFAPFKEMRENRIANLKIQAHSLPEAKKAEILTKIKELEQKLQSLQRHKEIKKLEEELDLIKKENRIQEIEKDIAKIENESLANAQNLVKKSERTLTRIATEVKDYKTETQCNDAKQGINQLLQDLNLNTHIQQSVRQSLTESANKRKDEIEKKLQQIRTIKDEKTATQEIGKKQALELENKVKKEITNAGILLNSPGKKELKYFQMQKGTLDGLQLEVTGNTHLTDKQKIANDLAEAIAKINKEIDKMEKAALAAPASQPAPAPVPTPAKAVQNEGPKTITYFKNNTDIEQPIAEEFQNVVITKDSQNKVINIKKDNIITVGEDDINKADQPTVGSNFDQWIAAHIAVEQKSMNLQEIKDLIKDANNKIIEIDRLDKRKETAEQRRLRGYLYNGLVPVLTAKQKKLEAK